VIEMQQRHCRQFPSEAQAPLPPERRASQMSAVPAIAAGACLTWAVVTSSLPFALSERLPQLALWLAPANPTALIAVADRARTRLIALNNPPEDAGNVSTGTKESSHQESASPPVEDAASTAEADRLRNEIKTAAHRAIASDPLNARAFRLLGELAPTTEEKRTLMKEALRRSRREHVAVLWLMADSFEREDFAGVIDMAEILFKTQASLTPESMRYLAALAELPQGRLALVAALSQQPVWRKRFFDLLPRNVEYAGTPFELFVSLKEAGSGVSDSEVAPYLEALIRENLIAYAHDIWLQLSANPKSDEVPLLNNPNFKTSPSGRPFDWAVRRGSNSTVEFAPLAVGSDSRAPQFSFDHARVQFPELSQLLVLEPGRYQLSGELSGFVTARRGLRWEIRCWKDKVLAQTEMLFGEPKKTWKPFTLEVDIPEQANCEGQTLRLFHDTRSASEQLISGQITFRHLAISGVRGN
jgi:hypothetical protein